jgi:hypothetical protein
MLCHDRQFDAVISVPEKVSYNIDLICARCVTNARLKPVLTFACSGLPPFPLLSAGCLIVLRLAVP